MPKTPRSSRPAPPRTECTVWDDRRRQSVPFAQWLERNPMTPQVPLPPQWHHPPTGSNPFATPSPPQP